MRSVFEFVDDGDSDSDAFGPELIELEALKLELGVTGDDDDAALAASITRWSGLIEDYLDRPLGLAHAQETFYFGSCEWSRPGAALPLKLYPVREIESVTVGGSEVEYIVDEVGGLIFLPDNGKWSGTVVVEYSGGYDLPDGAPAALQMAIIEAVRAAQSSASASAASASGIREIAHGDKRISFYQESSSSSSSSSSGGLPFTVVELIQPFRRFAF